MFGTIRRHQTWLWAIIITLTIISFVFYFSPYSKMNSDSRARGDHGSIYGKKVSDNEFRDAYLESHLHQFVMTGKWPEEDKRNDSERTAYQWLLLVRKQQQLGIEVSDDAAAKMARQMVRGFERIGVTSPQVFIDRVLGQKGYTADDFERFVRHFVGIQEMISIAGVSGTLIPPAEVKELYQRDHQELSTQAAFFWTSNYTASINPSPEVLSQFYSNRLATYIIPERVQVSYVRFNVTNYLPAAQATLTNLSELVEANYQRLGTNAFPDAKTPEEAKKRLGESILRQQANFMARSNALQFARQLNSMTPVKPENLATLARTNNLTVAVSEPFDRENGPKDLEVGPEFPKAAFALNEDEPYSQVLQGQDGAYIIAMNKQFPRETPTFAQVQERVTADYKRLQGMMLAQQAARSFQQAATNGLASGKSFADLCTASNIKPVDLPPFSISTRSLPQIEEVIPLNQLKQAAFSTAPGKVSPAFGTAEGAVMVYVKAKLPLDAAKMQADLPTFTAQIRRNRQQEAFDEWLRREAERGLRDTPLNRPQTPPSMGSSAKS